MTSEQFWYYVRNEERVALERYAKAPLILRPLVWIGGKLR